MEENENRTVVAKRDPDTKKKETARGLIYLAEFLLLGGIAVIVVKEMTKDSFTWYYGLLSFLLPLLIGVVIFTLMVLEGERTSKLARDAVLYDKEKEAFLIFPDSKAGLSIPLSRIKDIKILEDNPILFGKKYSPLPSGAILFYDSKEEGKKWKIDHIEAVNDAALLLRKILADSTKEEKKTEQK